MSEQVPPLPTATGQRAQVPARWIDTIRFTLADIVARGEWDDFGLFRILNRISFVCKNHLMFIVVFKRSFGEHGNRMSSRVRHFYEASPIISSLDPEFFDLTFEFLRKNKLINKSITYKDFLSNENLEIFLDEKKTPDYAIQVWGTPVFVIVLELHVGTVSFGKRPSRHLDPVNKSSQLGSFISETLKAFDGMEDTSESHPQLFSSRMSLSKESAEKGLALLREVNTLKRAHDDDPKPLNNKQRAFVVNAFQDVCKIIDLEYQRLRMSPILNSNKFINDKKKYKSSTNALFISKLFNSESMRYSHYKYNSQAVITDEQIKDITSIIENAQRSDYIPFDHGEIDNQFWERARTKKGRAYIADVVRKPTPSSVRLFAESVLMSGTTLIKPRVFERGAIGWIDDTPSPSDRLDALEHLGCLHFVLQLGSPVRPVEAKELSLVALPFRCSGGIWMCAVYVRENPSGPIEGVIDQKNFEESSLIYHSLFRETERRLRRRARTRYIDALGKIIAQATVETRSRHGNKAILCLDAAACDKFAKDMRLLTRIYPFDGIVPTTIFKNKSFLSFKEIDFESEPNGYFDRLTLHKFINEGNNKEKLYERVLLASIKGGFETDE